MKPRFSAFPEIRSDKSKKSLDKTELYFPPQLIRTALVRFLHENDGFDPHPPSHYSRHFNCPRVLIRETNVTGGLSCCWCCIFLIFFVSPQVTYTLTSLVSVYVLQYLYYPSPLLSIKKIIALQHSLPSLHPKKKR